MESNVDGNNKAPLDLSLFWLPVSVQALSTPAPDRPVRVLDLAVIAEITDEWKKKNARKHNRTGWKPNSWVKTQNRNN